MRVDFVESRAIPDTRSKPTVEATLRAGALEATASVPSGKSTGSHEAKELRDADGSVGSAVASVQGEIASLLKSREWTSPEEIDEALIALDGTQDKSRLGANAILSVSISASRLFALAEGVPLWKSIAKRAGTTPSAPRLYVNVMNGGAHAPTTPRLRGTSDFPLPFQEYLLVAEGKTSAALPAAQAAFAELGTKLGNVPMGDEGGYSPTFPTLQEPFRILADIIAAHPGTWMAIDAAATELRNDSGGYTLIDTRYTPADLLVLYKHAVQMLPLRSIEDPFAEDSDADFAKLTAELNGPSTSLGTTPRVLVVGDDFTVTNPARIKHAVEEKAINAVLIKPNQIGTVTEALRAVQATYKAGWQVICSHRSGETMDTFIADFAYGVGAFGLKAGGFAQPERMAKYERLLEIEKEAAQ